MTLEFRRIHLVGIGGAGMSALAKILLARGHEVSGSDLRAGTTLDGLADLGVEVVVGHAPELALKSELVVASSAIPDYDEELAAVRESSITLWRRPQLLAALSRQEAVIGSTGTHGKTTTASLMVAALRSAGVDPSFVIGGDLVELGTNGHQGGDDIMVLEVDEAFRTFESIRLEGLVLTNVEPEHLEHFGTYRDLLDSFVRVARAVEGPVVACLDDPGGEEVAALAGATGYGRSEAAAWRVTDVESGPQGVSFKLHGGGSVTRVTVRQPGIHIALNAAGTLALLAEMGYQPEEMVPGLADFRGVSRRWEHRGTVGGVALFDDYAHHPTEVGMTLHAARPLVAGRLWAVFQPHLFSRTERFSDEFGHALTTADVVVVTDIYAAREEPVPGVTGELVADAARKLGAEVHYVPHRADLASFLAPRLESGDMVLTMGAGDITLLHTELASVLAQGP